MTDRRIYIFVRSEGFYPLELGDDDEARANAECNPGTVRVEDAFGRIVWPRNTETSPPTGGEGQSDQPGSSE